MPDNRTPTGRYGIGHGQLFIDDKPITISSTIVPKGTDFADLEARVLAAAISGVIVLDIETKARDGYDFAAMMERHAIRSEKARLRPPPAYLQHDPTKRVRGRKR
jgi:hypothetical protein